MAKAGGQGSVGLLMLVGALACEEIRPPEVRPFCPTWKDDVRIEVEARCTGCHPSFQGYAGFTSDAIARPGAADSALLSALSPSSTIAAHRAPTSTRTLLRSWVVDCDLRYAGTPLHRAGLMDPRSVDFHAEAWAASDYSASACRDCHGSETSGRGDAPGCESCHAGGEEACSTCHAQIEKQGAHRVHLRGGALGLRYDCDLCHPVPSELRSPGHVLGAEGLRDLDGRADVQLGAAAGSTARFDPGTGSCVDVACHVARSTDSEATRPRPVWNEPQSGTACNRCHGEPPSGHVSSRCLDCHPAASLENGSNGPRHLNGQIDLGRSGAGTCDDCHGQGPLGAPPPDLMGRSSITIPTVGAHRAHLEPTRRLGNPSACSDCHLVPAEVSAPGHVDSLAPAEVFPPEIQDTSLAFLGGLEPVYRGESPQCENVYCHGLAEPNWTQVGLFEIGCGSCHGVPPTNEPHDATMTLQDCTQCHAESIDAFGGFIYRETPEGPRTVHIDGRVDF